MKLRVFGAAGAVLLLAACGAADTTGDAKLFSDAMDAYRAGDRAALAATLEAFDAAHPKDESGAVLEPCSAEDWEQRRIAYMRGMIENLDRPTVFSMSEEARLVYFDAVVLGQAKEIDVGDLPRCAEGSQGERPKLTTQAASIMAMRAFMKQHNAWKHDLEAQYGANLTNRLNQAAHTLEVNHMIPQQGGDFYGDLSDSPEIPVFKPAKPSS